MQNSQQCHRGHSIQTLPQQGQLPSACCYPTSGRVVSSGQSTDPATVQMKESKQEASESILWESQGPILPYTCTWRCLRMVVYRLGLGGGIRMAHNRLGTTCPTGCCRVELFVIVIGYCMTTIIQFYFQPRCKVLVVLEDLLTQLVHQLVKTQVHLKEDWGGNRLHMNT